MKRRFLETEWVIYVWRVGRGVGKPEERERRRDVWWQSDHTYPKIKDEEQTNKHIFHSSSSSSSSSELHGG